MKQFVKGLDKDEACFQYISEAFHGLSEKKKKMRNFCGPQIRQLFQDKNFAQLMTSVERDAWISFACYHAWLPRISLATLKQTIVFI